MFFHLSFCYCDFKEADRLTKNRNNKFRFQYYYIICILDEKCTQSVVENALGILLLIIYYFIAGGVPYRFEIESDALNLC